MTFTKNMLKLIGIKEIFVGEWLALGSHFGRKKLSNHFKLIQYIYTVNSYVNKNISSLENTPTNCLYTTHPYS